jgi:hypothetical protein
MRPDARRLLAVAGVVLLTTVAACTTTPAPPRVEPSATGGPAHQVRTASPPPPSALRTGEHFTALALPSPYTPKPPSGGTDDYRCFLLDPHLTAAAWVTGTQFLPDNGALVHHAIVFRVPAGQAPAAESWTCFSGTGVTGRLDQDASWIGAWAPSGGEDVLPAGTGFRLDPDSRIVLQVHYSLLATDGRPGGADRSALRLRLSAAGGLKALQTRLLPAPVELPCPPGQNGPLCDRAAAVRDVAQRFGRDAGAMVEGLDHLCHPSPGPTQSCDTTAGRAGTVYAVAGHMHLLGEAITVELNPGTSRARTLLDVDPYDFDNQRARPLAKPVRVAADDVLRVRCTHDATLRQRLPALAKLPPRYVVWGDGTADEMCLGIITWAR